MRRITALALTVTTLTAGVLADVSSVAAAPRKVGALVARCNSTSVASIPGGTTRYRGGAARLTRDCFVVLTPNARLILRNVEITGPHNLYIKGSKDGAKKNSLVIRNSTLSVGQDLFITPGRRNDDYAPGASVLVVDSLLRGDDLGLFASQDNDNGSVVVVDSTVRARDDEVHIRASRDNARGGTVRVQRSTIRAADGIALQTGRRGKTTVTANEIRTDKGVQVRSGFEGTTTFNNNAVDAGPVKVSAGARGSCTATANTPAINCR